MKWSQSMLLLTIACYGVIGSVDLHVVLEWVLYVVFEVCWVICNLCVSWYVVLMWKYVLKLRIVVQVFTLVTFRWCWVWVVKWDTIHALHQVLLMGYLGVRTNSKVKEHYCVWNDWCVLNAMYEFIWCYDHCICLYEVCEVYCVIVPMLVKFLPKGMLHDLKVKCPLQMHVFAWLTYLLHSCTNTILLHLFTQSVGYGC